jgi:hypothetical protein
MMKSTLCRAVFTVSYAPSALQLVISAEPAPVRDCRGIAEIQKPWMATPYPSNHFLPDETTF